MQSHPRRDPALPVTHHVLPVDADVPVRPHVPPHGLAHFLRTRWDVLLVIALGGAIGSVARFGVGVLLPHDNGSFAWSTFLVNVTGGFLLGVLMVFVADVWSPSRYVRAFLGVGVLGGFTTFSTYLLDTRSIVADGRPVEALAYLFGTLAVVLLAVWLGLVTGRAVTAPALRHTAPGAVHGDGAPDLDEDES